MDIEIGIQLGNVNLFDVKLLFLLIQLLYIASKCQKQDPEETHQLISMNST